jgi:hypothetical protein
MIFSVLNSDWQNLVNAVTGSNVAGSDSKSSRDEGYCIPNVAAVDLPEVFLDA